MNIRGAAVCRSRNGSFLEQMSGIRCMEPESFFYHSWKERFFCEDNNETIAAVDGRNVSVYRAGSGGVLHIPV